MQNTEYTVKKDGGRHRERPGSFGDDRQRGAMLIIALGVLTLLAVLGASFAQLMRLERKAANNYVDAQRMEMMSSSALDMMIAKFHEASNHYSWSFYGNTDWLFRLLDEDDLAHGRAGVEDPRVGRWRDYLDVAGYRFQYKTKVIDTSSQINLNGRQDTLARMLDNLGVVIEKSPRLSRDGRNSTNPFYTGARRTGLRISGESIMLFRQRLEGQRFQSKNQLRQLIGDENYEIVKDFLTCHSWLDPYTYKADDGDNEVRDLALGMSTTSGGGGVGGVGGGGGLRMPSAVGSPRLGHEPRFPININTAPEEVLISCFMGLAGRRTFPYSRLGVAGGVVTPVDQAAEILGERVFADEELRDITPRPVFVYTPKFEYAEALKIVQQIISNRKNARRFFRTWRSNDPSQPGFEDFIDSLDSSFFPSFNNVIVIDPDQPNNRLIRGHVIGGGATPLGRLWQKGTAQGAERNTFRKLGLAVHDNNAWYYDLVKGVVKSNFNPNTRISRYNPNLPAYTPVDKSDLVWADPVGGQIPLLKKGHTTEFCFGPMGIFEVTTLGQMIDKSQWSERTTRTVVSSRSRSRVEEVPADLHPFRRKIRTVVKVFEVLRHTNQFHFEKTFNIGSRSSKNDRKFVQTWPEPMNALTELYSQGTRRDGRVELAGLLDARRQQSPYMTRSQMFGRDPSILAEHSFSERDPQNVSRLRRSLQGSGVSFFGDEVGDALKGVYDLNFSRFQRKYREFYRLKLLQNLNVFRGNVAAQYTDPIVGKEEIGTDLFPDGFNSSLFRQQHLGNRLLVLPARQRLGEAGLGGGNIRIGSSGVGSRGQNQLGNVPYYEGGIGFWVKFEFDGDDPVFSGLLGCTQVIREVLPASQEYSGSEGSQFFLFKNTRGQLRVVRMYYHQAFPDAGAGEGGGGGVKLFPDPGSDADGAPGQGENPILEHLDQQKIISRADIVADIKHFKAHEWHHIAMDWNDANPVFPIRLYVDFKEVTTGGTPRRAQQVIDGTANSWVRLNHRQPIDGLMVGGIVRAQGVADAGVFKWFTTTAKTGGGSGGGVATVAPSVKRILANATIDEMIIYEGSFPQVKRYYGGNAGAGYFTQRTGEYANLFEVPLPTGVNSVALRSFDWTSYYPTTYTDSLPNSNAVQLVNTPIECEVFFRTPTALPPRLTEPWRSPARSLIAGRRIYRQETGLKGQSAEFVYKFFMKGSKSLSGNTAGGVVQTPVIDDVTLSYYLPNPKILLQEDVD